MKIIGFDFDGVFINIEDEKAKLFGEILYKHWGINSDLARKVWVMNLGTSRRYKFDCIYREYYKSKLKDEQYQEIESEFSEILLKEYYPQVTLIKDSVENARYFKDKFDLSFISSGVTDKELQFLVTRYGLTPYFDYVFGTNQKYKSKNEHFAELSKNNNIDFGIFIGDGLEDMRIAKQFNFIAVGLPVNHGAHALFEAGADSVCTYAQLSSELENLIAENSVK